MFVTCILMSAAVYVFENAEWKTRLSPVSYGNLLSAADCGTFLKSTKATGKIKNLGLCSYHQPAINIYAKG